MSPAGVPAGTVLALDIGGTKVEAGVVRADGTIVSRARIETRTASPDLLTSVLDLLGRVRGRHDVAALGVGCGGPMRRGGVSVSPLNIPEWRELPLRDELERATSLAVSIDNDAKALALGEGRFGAARGVTDYLSMVVSTGVGGGIVLDGRLLDGREGNAGHIGHVVVEPGGRECACGSRGCLEAEASGTAITAMTGARAEHAALAERRRCGEMVGRAVSSVAVLLDLERCFIAGSVALGFGEPFFAAANEAVARLARIEHARGLRIEPSALGADGPLLGAAAVAWRGSGR
jgi:glucokinase